MVNYPEGCRYMRLDISNASGMEAQLFDSLLDGRVDFEINLNNSLVRTKDLKLIDIRPLSISHILVVVQITRDAVVKPAPKQEEPDTRARHYNPEAGKPKDFNEINKQLRARMRNESEKAIEKKKAEVKEKRENIV